MARLFLLAVLVTLALLSTVVQAQAPRGKCMTFAEFEPLTILSGYNMPVCKEFLQQAGITHFWVNEHSLPNNNPECYNEMYLWSDLTPAVTANIFEPDKPSTVCQSVINASLCFMSYKSCDPEVDIDTYVSNKRICPWLCNILVDESALLEQEDAEGNGTNGTFCTQDDGKWLTDAGLNLSFVTKLSAFNCKNTTMYTETDDDPSCLAPKFVFNRPVAGRCEPYVGEYCSSVFQGGGTQVYIPPGQSQESMEAAMAFGAPVYNVLPPDSACIQSTTRVFCQSMFRECIDVGITKGPKDTAVTGLPMPGVTPTPTGIAFGLKPPMVSCTDFVSECSDTPFFESLTGGNGRPIIDCRGNSYNPSKCWVEPQALVEAGYRSLISLPQTVNFFNSRAFFDQYEYQLKYFDGPTGFTVYQNNNFASSDILAVASVPYTAGCTPPLIVDYDNLRSNIYQGRCAIPCPTPAYTPQERSRIETAAWVFTIISLVFVALLVANFFIFKSQRHKKLLLWYTISFLLAMVFLVIGLAVRQGDRGDMWESQCRTPTQYEHGEGFALFQGFMLTYFLLASTCWWAMQAIDLFQRLILGKSFHSGSKARRHRDIAMHLFCWGMPLMSCVALTVAGQYGYSGYLPFSFISQSPLLTSSALPLEYVFFFAPIMVLAIVSYVLVIIVLVYLIKYDTTGGLKKFHDALEQKKSFWMKLQQSLKLFGFALLMLPFYILLVIHEVSVAGGDSGWDKALVTWGESIALNPELAATTHVSSRYSPGLIILATFGFTSPGFLMFLLYFVFSSDVYGLWAGLLYRKLGVTFLKSLAREDTLSTGSSNGSRGSSNGSSTGKSNTISTDLLTGGGETQLTGRRGQSNVPVSKASEPSSLASVSPPPAPRGLNLPQQSTTQSTQSTQSTSKQSTARRGTLFKGFKSNNMRMPPTSNSSDSKNVSGDNEVELMSTGGSPAFSDRSINDADDSDNEIMSPSQAPPRHIHQPDAPDILEASVEDELSE